MDKFRRDLPVQYTISVISTSEPSVKTTLCLLNLLIGPFRITFAGYGLLSVCAWWLKMTVLACSEIKYDKSVPLGPAPMSKTILSGKMQSIGFGLRQNQLNMNDNLWTLRLVDNRDYACIDLENHRLHQNVGWTAHYYVHCTRKSHQKYTFRFDLWANSSPRPGNRKSIITWHSVIKCFFFETLIY